MAEWVKEAVKAAQALDPKLLLDELRKERFAHRRTVARFKATMGRLAVRDSTQRTAIRFCALCREVPVGENPDRYRKACVHNYGADVLAEYARLEQRWDDYKRELVERVGRPQIDAAQEQQAEA